MADRKLTDYSSEELAKALDKMTIISEEFEIFASIATDFFWERVARKPWFIIYESDENDINGREVETIDEVKRVLYRNLCNGYKTLYVLKEGKLEDFSVEVNIDIKE